MFAEERKEGSPRFAKLHFPVGLWVNNLRKLLAQIRHRWPSAASVLLRLRQHGKAKAGQHKRLSSLFHRNYGAPISNVTAAPHGNAAAAAPHGAGQHWVSAGKWGTIEPVSNT